MEWNIKKYKMLITGTSDIIQFKLAVNTTTTALPFTVDYNNYTLTAVSVLTNNGTSNNTAAVSLVPSPSSGQQNELRYCSIYNADTVSATVTIQVYDGSNTRVVFRAVLASGDMLQYQIEKGWEVIDAIGNKKNFGLQSFSSSMKFTKGWRPHTVSSTFTLTGAVGGNHLPVIIPLGRADKPYSSITASVVVTTAAASITWLEAAIYNTSQNLPEVANVFNNRAGFIDASGIFNSTGVKKIIIPVSGINTGDILRLVIGSVAVTNPTLRAFLSSNVDISENSFGTFTGTTGNSARLSGNNFFYYGGVATAFIQTSWQGT